MRDILQNQQIIVNGLLNRHAHLARPGRLLDMRPQGRRTGHAAACGPARPGRVRRAGRYRTVLAVQGATAVMDALRTCWASAPSGRTAQDRPAMAVLVQRLVDADTSGVLFTPTPTEARTRIEASWGLGPSTVGGTVTPDTYLVAPDGAVRHALGSKATRMDRDRLVGGLTTRPVPSGHRATLSLDDGTARELTDLGRRVASELGQPQDIEWALAGNTLWVLQARPITAPLPPWHTAASDPQGRLLAGTPGSHGVASGTARVLHGPSDIPRVRPGDVVVCRDTDPAWTPLFRVAAGVVTEAGGALSHAAIVAREQGIPAALGVRDATTTILDGRPVTVDGTAGTVLLEPS
ncbi:PEP/pyruvate-binding domain-containing protein [Isoptericola halotolerans]|uniref:PEP/pyruvate-binding domain-containing protein n=1 Tax=Isoptericola halotolerans TaxID=300560 RepID=UPI00388EDF64